MRDDEKIITEVKELIYGYLENPEITELEFKGNNFISPRIFNRVKRMYEEGKKSETRLERIQEETLLEEDPISWWKKRTLELNNAILASAKKGNAQSQKLAKQLAGELVEKAEVKFGLTADERARRNSESEQELREFRNQLGQRVV